MRPVRFIAVTSRYSWGRSATAIDALRFSIERSEIERQLVLCPVDLTFWIYRLEGRQAKHAHLDGYGDLRLPNGVALTQKLHGKRRLTQMPNIAVLKEMLGQAGWP